MSRCECSMAGFCRRHRVDKTPHLKHLCETKEEYFNAWELGRGPGQLASNAEKEGQRAVRSKRINLRSKYIELWRSLFSDVDSIEKLDEWQKGIPSFGCDCSEFYKNWIARNYPTKVDFEWKWRLKSAVNEKLGKDNLSIDEARVVVGDPMEFVQQRRTDIVAVTSLSTKKHSLCRQLDCIRSWQKFGLDVYVRNTAEEIKALERVFTGVNWIEDEDVSDKYDFPTQRIRNLARTAIEIDNPVLVINSDCEMRGYKDWLSFSEEKQFIGIRWNFEKDFPHVVTEFRWGLDAFSFTPKQAAMLPEDFFFAIGHPVWDYAVPALMRQNGVELSIPHQPFIFHQNHSINWNRAEWDIGKKWMRDRIGVEISWDKSDFRDSLEGSGWKYSHTRWVKTS